MEPKLPSPNRGPELTPSDLVRSSETVSQLSSSETTPGRSAERGERQGETVPPAETVHIPAVTMPAVAIPVIQDGNDDSATTLPQVQSDTPAIANDNELIEKEWVDKAKKVIAETRDDPYRREQEVNKLQADYLFKRYGRKLGSPQ